MNTSIEFYHCINLLGSLEYGSVKCVPLLLQNDNNFMVQSSLKPDDYSLCVQKSAIIASTASL